MARRPRNPSQVTSIKECEQYRGEVSREISRKITKLDDESLSEYQIRDLNDIVNNLMHERHEWEAQLKQLGGPDYVRSTSGSREYKYYGRAKLLPGAPQTEPKKKPKDKLKPSLDKLNASYFGFGNDTEQLLAEEKQFVRNVHIRQDNEPQFEPIEQPLNIPDQAEIEKYLMERKKQQLEMRYL